ncbi:sulfur carrier protein ThiS [Piscinibacter sp.]|jgi:sulfur carrier protein|uniref:sulfur carrier protein ThiS n=1 Tax=Piscinibacter sp. TaxID=1903157 RepID=UPI002F3EFE34
MSLAVVVNGDPHTLSEDTRLADLLTRLGHAPETVAVAVNGEFVPRASRCDRVLRDGDQVSCFAPIVGG